MYVFMHVCRYACLCIHACMYVDVGVETHTHIDVCSLYLGLTAKYLNAVLRLQENPPRRIFTRSATQQFERPQICT